MYNKNKVQFDYFSPNAFLHLPLPTLSIRALTSLQRLPAASGFRSRFLHKEELRVIGEPGSFNVQLPPLSRAQATIYLSANHCNEY